MNHHHPSSSTIIHSSFITNIHQSGLVLVPAFFMLNCLPVTFQVGKHEAELRSLQHRGAPKLRKSLEVVVFPDVFVPEENCCLVGAFYQFQQATWGEMIQVHQCELFFIEV